MAQSLKIRFHQFGGNDALRVDCVEQSAPDARQILVTVRAASVNPVDFKIRSGRYPSVKEDRLPYTPGRDVDGIVDSCGAQVTKFRPGDEVFGMVPVFGGGYAEQVVLDERAVAYKPRGLDHLHSAAIPLAGQTAHQGLFRYGKLKAGESILIMADPAVSAISRFNLPRRTGLAC
ncbi:MULTISPECIES: NADP-dependent oxidoreductase [unclassified Bradyrhizobium]